MSTAAKICIAGKMLFVQPKKRNDKAGEPFRNGLLNSQNGPLVEAFDVPS